MALGRLDLRAGALVDEYKGVALVVGLRRTRARSTRAGRAIVLAGQRHAEAFFLRLWLWISCVCVGRKGGERKCEGGCKGRIRAFHDDLRASRRLKSIEG